jgi:hypothetical protein
LDAPGDTTADYLVENSPDGKHLTLFNRTVPAVDVDHAGVATIGPHQGKGVAVIAGAWWVPDASVVAHEWGHSFGGLTDHVWPSLMGTGTPPTLFPSERLRARAVAERYYQ